jgi:hypothetical protein
MPRLSESRNDALKRLELLVSELVAIRHWDETHWKAGKHARVTEVDAYEARQKRYDEILSRLLIVTREVAHWSEDKGDCDA